ncbi:hypothetical protein ACSFA3_19255 [Variovorax sp. RHLX14]|uniref:hypothetical protein n=1 Tax=Variovorax sp. RHLX14 TaxID=1259731 RepID=UPI003F488951
MFDTGKWGEECAGNEAPRIASPTAQTQKRFLSIFLPHLQKGFYPKRPEWTTMQKRLGGFPSEREPVIGQFRATALFSQL